MIKVAFFPSATEYGQHVFPLFTPSDSAFEKIAAPTLIPEVAKYIENLRPEPGAQYVLVNAMGSGEFYGSNVNGDYFPEASLIHVPSGWTGVPAMDSVLAKNWPYGYPTFYRAFPFAHHRNKDPQKAYGVVVFAGWNPRMRRVELIIKIEHTKCVEHGGLAIWDKIRAGQFPDVSMGCRVPFDTCSICLDEALYQKALATFDPRKHPHPGKAALEFHKTLKERDGVGVRGLAVTRKDYCEHARLEMNKIYPDGRKVWVVNDFPNFFDISFVFIGAEKCAKMMMKIAHRAHAYFRLSADVAHELGYIEDGEKVAAASPQLAFERAFEDLLTKDALAKRARIKDAEIIKDTVPSQFAAQAVPLLTAREPDLPKSLVRIMAGLPTEESLGTAASLGVVLRPREFQRLLLTKFGLEDEADDLEKKKIVFPDVEEEEQMDVKPQCFNRLLAGLLLPLLSGRSSFGPSIERRVTILVVGGKPEFSRATSPPSELLHKMGSAYKGYRRSLMNAIPQMEPVVRDSSSGELCKLASGSLDNLLTPLSHAYLQGAFMDELGGEKKARASANAQRGLPSKIACAGNQLSHGDSK